MAKLTLELVLNLPHKLTQAYQLSLEIPSLIYHQEHKITKGKLKKMEQGKCTGEKEVKPCFNSVLFYRFPYP